MAVGKFVPTPASVATVIAKNDGTHPAYVVVTNPHASHTYRLGGSDVSDTNYGITVATASGTAAFYLNPQDTLYGFTVGSTIPATTGTATTNIFSSTTHTMSIGDAVRFTVIAGGDGLATNTTYYIISDSFTANAFKLSLTPGGTEVDFTTNLTSATTYKGTTARVFISGGY